MARDCNLPNEPPHLKVHSGLMLAALKDIQERVASTFKKEPKVAFDNSCNLPPLRSKKFLDIWSVIFMCERANKLSPFHSVGIFVIFASAAMLFTDVQLLLAR